MGNRPTYRHYILIMLILVIGSCKKNSNTTTTPNGFIKEFNFSGTASYGAYIEETSDHNLLIIGREGTKPGNLFICKTDLKGNLLWHKSITKDTFTVDYIRAMNNGTYLNSDYNWFSMIDSTGNFLWSVNNSSVPSAYLGSDAIYSNGKYYQGFSNGSANGNASNSFVYVYDNNHKYLTTYYYNDNGFNAGKTNWIDVLGAYPNNSLKILGVKFYHKAWNWTDPWKIFYGTASTTAFTDTVSFEGQKTRYYDNPYYFITTPDSGFVILSTRIDAATNLSSILVLNLDKSLVLKSENTYSYNGFATTPQNVSRCGDGGYLIVGQFKNTLANSNNNGYLLRVDANGNKLWEKTFSPAGSSILYACTELSDGSIAVTGSTTSFGKGKNGNDILLMRLDANGDLK